MSARFTRLPVDRIPGTSALFRDFCARGPSPLHEMLGGSRSETAVWRGVLSRGGRLDPRLAARMGEFNAELGAPPRALERIAQLGAGTARAVVTGQQPGVLGGPLLTLHKLATTVALARAVEARHGTPCVPVFWLGADDDDFAEIRELTVMGADSSLVETRVSADAYRPGMRIGDISAGAAMDAWKAVVGMTGAAETAAQVERAAASARDFAGAAARVVAWATQGEVVLIDGREPLLRVCGEDLLLEFLDSEEELRRAIDAGAARMAAMGYPAQLHGGEDSGLFLLRDGVRQRIPMERRQAARAEIAADITRVSPGVVARNLLQDAVLAPAAVVIGPAEVAYRAQLAEVYRRMRVPMPVAVPRLTATYVPPAIHALAESAGLDESLLAVDVAAFVRAAEASARDAGFAAAAEGFGERVRSESARFESLARARLDERAAEKMHKRLAEVVGRLERVLADAVEQDGRGARARWPFLARMHELFVHDGKPQERYLSLLVPFLAHGPSAWSAIGAVAQAHERDSLDGRVWHGVYSV